MEALGGAPCHDFEMGAVPAGRSSRATVALWAACGLAWLACDLPRPAESAPSAAPLARGVCEAGCARRIRCDGPRAAACACESARAGEVLRADWAAAEIACLARTTCDAPDDCASEAYRAIGAAPLDWPPVVMRCLQRGDACGGSSETCRRLAALNDDARTEVAPCFDLACDEATACLDAFVAHRIAWAIPLPR